MNRDKYWLLQERVTLNYHNTMERKPRAEVVGNLLNSEKYISLSALVKSLHSLLFNNLYTSDSIVCDLVDPEFLEEIKEIIRLKNVLLFFGESLRELKCVISQDGGLREHELIIHYKGPKKLRVSAVALPPSSLLNREYNSIMDILTSFEEYVESLSGYFYELERIDRFCTVMEPAKPSFRENYRKILLDDRTWLHVEITPKGFATNIHLLGHSEQWHDKLQAGLLNWDHDKDIVENITTVFDIMNFPTVQKSPCSLEGTDSSDETVCSICLCSELPDMPAVPQPLCQNPECVVYFHRNCLFQVAEKRWVLRAANMIKGLWLLVYLLHCQGAVVSHVGSAEEFFNNRPIVGLLSQEQSVFLHTKYPKENYTSYIASSYVKDVESAGARVVPIMIGKHRSYYKDLLGKLNGVLFPGGATYFNQSDGFADAGQHILELAQELNDAGHYFPMYGTCLGFQLIIILASGRGKNENRRSCYSFENLPLQFTNDFRTSKMYGKAEEGVLDLLATEDITVNYHQFCITDDNLKAYNLTDDWRATSYGDDQNGVRFIASYEHRRYPFYGTQFHPEKMFEWMPSMNYPHFKNAVRGNRHFMDFFVDECRKSRHTFASASEENQYVIYNHQPHFTGVLGSAYHQCYLFEPRGTVSNN